MYCRCYSANCLDGVPQHVCMFSYAFCQTQNCDAKWLSDVVVHVLRLLEIHFLNSSSVFFTLMNLSLVFVATSLSSAVLFASYRKLCHHHVIIILILIQ